MAVSRRAMLQGSVAASASMLVTGPTARAVTGAGAIKRKARFAGDPGTGRLYYGASTDKDLGAWERSMGSTLSMHRTYHQAGGVAGLVAAVKADLAAGRLPHASTKCPGSWQDVAAGTHDEWLRSLRRQLAAVDQPVLLTFHHEPENDSGGAGRAAADYVAMQTHIIALFAKRAPKVTIVPVLQGWSFDPSNAKRDPAPWNVPTASVVGFDLYNPFSSSTARWVTLETRLKQVSSFAGDRPIAIGEYGCREDPFDPDRGAQWMRDAFASARDYNVVSMSYFNSSRNAPDGTWHLDGGRAVVFERRLESPNVARL